MSNALPPEQKSRLYSFWKWEYTRRNPEYQSVYNKYVSIQPTDPIPTSIRVGMEHISVFREQYDLAMKIYQNYQVFPKQPDEQLGSTEGAYTSDALIDYFNVDETRYVPGNDDFKIAPPLNGLEIGKVVLPDGSDANPCIHFSVSLNGNIEQSLLELEYYYYYYNALLYSDLSSFHPGHYLRYFGEITGEEVTDTRLDKLHNKMSSLKHKLIALWYQKNSSMVQNKLNLARAIGLWLVDHRNDFDSFASSAKFLLDHYQFPQDRWCIDLSRDGSPYKTFELYMKATRTCIQQGNVLPLNWDIAKQCGNSGVPE